MVTGCYAELDADAIEQYFNAREREEDALAEYDELTVAENLYIYGRYHDMKKAEIKLDDAPVYDGLAIAGRRVYVSTVGGSLLCFGSLTQL